MNAIGDLGGFGEYRFVWLRETPYVMSLDGQVFKIKNVGSEWVEYPEYMHQPVGFVTLLLQILVHQ